MLGQSVWISITTNFLRLLILIGEYKIDLNGAKWPDWNKYEY